MVLLKGTFLPMNGIMEPAAKGSVHVPVLLKGCPVNHDAHPAQQVSGQPDAVHLK